MKSIIKLTCIMMALLSMLVIAGCSNKPDYTGTWIGYDGENAPTNGDGHPLLGTSNLVVGLYYRH